MIKISDLTFDYPGRRALNQVSFTIEQGSVTALVGSNGAGKTTLMRCIAGLETPLSGGINVAGMDVVDKPREVHRKMGYLSDFFGLYQDLNVAQCFEYAAAAQGLPAAAIQHAVMATAQQLGLAERLNESCGNLSRGLRQRVAIGQAIIHSPQVLLLDEPASGLDPEARHELAKLFRQLNAEGMTILVSSHILSELDEYSSHILSLREGRLLEHRALGQGSDEVPRRRMHVKLARPSNQLLHQLSASSMVSKSVVNEADAEFDFSGDELALSALLAALISNGLQVTNFTEQKENLQQSYLRSIESYTGARS